MGFFQDPTDPAGSSVRTAGPAPPGDRRREILTSGDELDINAGILPDYTAFLDTLDDKFPNEQIEPVLLFETSRGCPRTTGLPCKFCGLNGTTKGFEAMSPENAIAQIKAICTYAPRSTFFINVDKVLPDNYTRDVFPFLPPRNDISIRYEVLPTITAKDIQALCRTGVCRCQPGIESLSNTTLKLMRKGTTSFANLQFLKNCTRHPFSPEWNLLINTPGELQNVYEKYLRDIPLLTHLPPPNGVFPIMFVRFGDYFYHPEKHGLDLQPQDYYELIYPFRPRPSPARRLFLPRQECRYPMG